MRVRGRGGCQQPVQRGRDAPFTRREGEVLSLWAAGRLDASDERLWTEAPGALRAILAERHGWASLRGPGLLTWREANLSLQLAAEERVGAVLRLTAEIARAQEDAAWAAATGEP